MATKIGLGGKNVAEFPTLMLSIRLPKATWVESGNDLANGFLKHIDDCSENANKTITNHISNAESPSELQCKV